MSSHAWVSSLVAPFVPALLSGALLGTENGNADTWGIPCVPAAGQSANCGVHWGVLWTASGRWGSAPTQRPGTASCAGSRVGTGGLPAAARATHGETQQLLRGVRVPLWPEPRAPRRWQPRELSSGAVMQRPRGPSSASGRGKPHSTRTGWAVSPWSHYSAGRRDTAAAVPALAGLSLCRDPRG